MKRHEPGPPMDLDNMRKQGVTRLIAYCLNDACRRQALIEVWSYPANTEIAYFKRRVVCAKCGARGNKIDVRPNWKEAIPVQDWRGNDARPGEDNG
jgi:transposase